MFDLKAELFDGALPENRVAMAAESLPLLFELFAVGDVSFEGSDFFLSEQAEEISAESAVTIARGLFILIPEYFYMERRQCLISH